MRQTFLTISAATSQEALLQASQQLQAPPEHIAVSPLSDGQFKAELLHHDADLRVEISPEKMKAAIVDSIPAKGQGCPLSQERLRKILMDSGVRVAPDADTAAQVLEQLRLGRDVSGMVIAKGVPPKLPQDALVEPLGDWAFPVFPGDLFARYVPPAPGVDGLLVTGERIPVKTDSRSLDIVFAKDSGCRLDPETLLVTAEQYGLAGIEAQQARVLPLLRVAADKMAVLAVAYHRTSRGDPITPEMFRAVLEREQITAPLRTNALLRALEKAKQEEKPVEDFVLCRGTLPQDGLDGGFEPAAASTSDDFGLETSGGRIDYRARGIVRSVQTGDLLGRIIPPEPGIPGMDVFGWPTPARQGKPFILVPGENVRVSQDGTEFFATAEGMVFFLGRTLKVTEIFETKGDVNLTVGNIKLERGSVHVRGSVLAGFRVEAPANVVVREVVENAVIVAGGDVQAGCGIVMDQGGLVEAGGGISAGYAQNAVLHAQGDVNIAHEINNCKIFAARSVIATRGRGKIIGGVLHCGEGVLAKEIGSPLGVKTVIHLGVDRKTEINLARKAELEETLQKIYSSVGSGGIKAILENTAQEKRPLVAEVLKARVRCEQELLKIEDMSRREREDLRSNVNLRVKASKMIHPDVVIHCFKARFTVVKPLSNATIYYDAQQRKLVPA